METPKKELKAVYKKDGLKRYLAFDKPVFTAHDVSSKHTSFFKAWNQDFMFEFQDAQGKVVEKLQASLKITLTTVDKTAVRRLTGLSPVNKGVSTPPVITEG